jgi:two-component system NtrC family sensor kinase
VPTHASTERRDAPAVGSRSRPTAPTERFRYDADRGDSPFAASPTALGHAYFEQLRRRLRWRLLAAYVVPLVLLLAYFHFEYTGTLREGINQHLASIADNQRNTVDLFLQERAVNVRNAFVVDRVLRPQASSRVMTQLLTELRAKSRAFVDVGLFDPAGTLIAYAGPHASLQGRSYRDQGWLKEVLTRESGTFISDVYLGFRGEPHFIIAETRRVDGEPWTLRASVDPQEFAAFVGRSHLVEQAEAFVVNRRGERQTSARDSQGEPPFPMPSLTGGETVLAPRTVHGTSQLTAIAPLRATDWALVVMVPERQAYAPVTRARLVIGTLLVLTLVLVIAFALRSSNRLVGRLEQADTEREELTRQLFNAAKLASVGEMAAGVAHEINDPLAIIYETAGVMKDILNPEFQVAFDPVQFRDHLGVIEEATLRGRNITRQLLAFARKHEPDPEPLDLNVEVNRALGIKENEFRVSDIEVETDLDPDLPTALADANQLEQVLLNLLNNARDAIGEQGRVAVRTRREGRYAVIEVRDSGCGMTRDQVAKAFLPFFTTKEVGRGTGLGLSISHGIIKEQGGRIEVESEPGAGTVFFIYLPFAVPPPARVAGGAEQTRRS